MFDYIIFFFYFVIIAFSANFVVAVVLDLSKSLRLSSLFISFFLLGILTSLPEISIGVSALIANKPEMIVGNLLGGVMVVLFFILPISAWVNGGMSIPKDLNQWKLTYLLIVLLAPALLTADRKIDFWESLLLVSLYLVLPMGISRQANWWEKFVVFVKKPRRRTHISLLKLILGVVGLIISSQGIVQQSLIWATKLKLSSFWIGLIVLSIGSNLPEIFLAIAGLFKKKNDIVVADFLGSASANTLILGILAILYGKNIYLPNDFLLRLFILTIGLVLFYVFARSRNQLSKIEGVFLILFYSIFLLLELVLVLL